MSLMFHVEHRGNIGELFFPSPSMLAFWGRVDSPSAFNNKHRSGGSLS